MRKAEVTGGGQYPGPAVALTHDEAVVHRDPHVERQGAKMPYTSRNGHMFSFLDDDVMALQLPDDPPEFVTGCETGPVERYGR